jgi:uncharacterized membrane protein (DUF485 family)
MKALFFVLAFIMLFTALYVVPHAGDYNMSATEAQQRTLASNYSLVIAFLSLCMVFILRGRELRRANPARFDREFYKA